MQGVRDLSLLELDLTELIVTQSSPTKPKYHRPIWKIQIIGSRSNGIRSKIPFHIGAWTPPRDHPRLSHLDALGHIP